MVEIIRRGTPPSERVYTGSCYSCRTEVRFKQHEARSSQDQREPGYYVECPVCRVSIFGKLEGGR
jgi:hypothetical protein